MNVSVPFNVSNFTSLEGWLKLCASGYPAWIVGYFIPTLILAIAFAIWLRTRNVTPTIIWLLVTSSLAVAMAGQYVAPEVHLLLYFIIAIGIAWLVYLALK